jgi:hypothetical protein
VSQNIANAHHTPPFYIWIKIQQFAFGFPVDALEFLAGGDQNANVIKLCNQRKPLSEHLGQGHYISVKAVDSTQPDSKNRRSPDKINFDEQKTGNRS